MSGSGLSIQTGGGDMYYALTEDKQVIETDIEGYAEFWNSPERIVQVTELWPDVRVSTVFLGLDHRWYGGGPPIVFETMVFGGELDQEQVRYCTYDEALAGHAEMAAKVEKAEKAKLARAARKIKRGKKA